MPQDSALYGVARIRCHEKDLIGKDKLHRMAEGTLEDAMRVLQDAGYGHVAEAGAAQGEELIASELRAAYQLVREVTFDQKLTDLFLMKADIHNLKLLLKLRLTGSQDKPALMEGGCYTQEALAKMVQEGSYKELPEELAQALMGLEQSFQTGVDPAEISIRLDRAYIAYALRTGGKEAQPYFKAQADFGNILTALRIRANGGGAAKLRDALLPEGDIPHSRIMQALEAPADGLGKLLATGPVRDRVLKGLDGYLKNGSIAGLERERDNYLISLASQGKYAEGIGPVIGYLMAREQEAKCVRLILTAKRNGLEESVITERLRELYG